MTFAGKSLNPVLILITILNGFASAAIAQGSDSPQWGEKHSRNMVSKETGLPASFNPATGENIKWVVYVGTENYATPVVAGGKILLGANNADQRDPRHAGDRGVLLCLNEADGSLAWQLVVPRIGGDRHNDWPMVGICSPPLSRATVFMFLPIGRKCSAST